MRHAQADTHDAENDEHGNSRNPMPFAALRKALFEILTEFVVGFAGNGLKTVWRFHVFQQIVYLLFIHL